MSVKKIPVIDITDLYHPYQDPGDNVDLLTAYALPEIDLRAVLIDVTEDYRRQPQNDVSTVSGVELREPGVIPVTQCNYMFGRSVKYGIGPFRRMKSLYDDFKDVTGFMNAVDLLLAELKRSTVPIHILCFGSLRILAAAYNRNPSLLREKTACVHISAGASGRFLEWNVLLDRMAFVRIMRSELPINFYPCATQNGPFDMGIHNTYWRLDDISFIKNTEAPLRRYLIYAFSKSNRSDFLNCLEFDCLSDMILESVKRHNVWETAIWMNVAGRVLAHTDSGCRYLPLETVKESDIALSEELIPCELHVEDEGFVNFKLINGESHTKIYRRSLPKELNQWMKEAFSALYIGYSTETSDRFDSMP